MELPKVGDDVWNARQRVISDDLISACKMVVSELRESVSSCKSAVSKAQTHFTGGFSEAFDRNTVSSDNDRVLLLECLAQVERIISDAQDAAIAEQARVNRAKEWKARHDNWEKNKPVLEGDWNDSFESLWYEWWHREPEINIADTVAGDLPSFKIDVSGVSAREVPSIGQPLDSASYSSSAVPEYLRVFTDTMNTFSDSLERSVRVLQDKAEIFESEWLFREKNSPVFAAMSGGRGTVVGELEAFIANNRADAWWVHLVAAAFEEAGGSSGHLVSLSNATLSTFLASYGITSLQRSKLQIPEFEMLGVVLSTGYAADPVNSVTGNFIEPEVDLSFAGIASSLNLRRMYNSRGDVSGVFGQGWCSVLDQCLVFTDDDVQWVMADGRHVFFPRVVDGCVRAERDNYWLERVSVCDVVDDFFVVDGVELFMVRDNSCARWFFFTDGRWYGSWNASGTGVRAVYCGDRIVRLEHEFGRCVGFAYADGLVVEAKAGDGRRVGYVYDEGRLVSCVSVLGVRGYVWDEAGRFVVRVVSGSGVVEVENLYDESGRVVEQVSEHGRVSRFAYLPGFVTQVADGDGSRANTWVGDCFGRTVGVVDADGQRQSMSYDRFGNLVQLVERDGAVTVHVYDDSGRRVRSVLPGGGEVRYGWDERGRIVEVALDNGSTTRYEYGDDFSFQPCVIVDGVGGVTRLSWDRGLLTGLVDPEGVGVSFGYNSFGELVGVSNGLGDTWSVERDGVGRVTALVSPLGGVWRYEYDQRGLLVACEDAEGGVWGYGWDEAGRLVGVSDPYGAVESCSYGECGLVESVTDRLGRVTRVGFDDLGNLASLVLPDGTSWGFVFDALSRLRQVCDGVGGVWGFDYSLVGDLARVTDPSGVSVGWQLDSSRESLCVRDTDGSVAGLVGFDSYGRPVRYTGPDGSVSALVYDRVGRVVEFGDLDGGVTLLHRDLAGRVVERVDPDGLVTAYGYDERGLLATVTRPGGLVSRYVYDPDCRLVEIVEPDGSRARFSYDRVGRLTRACVPGRGVSVYRYDRCGRVVYVREPLTGERRFVYDAAGQLVAAVNGVGGVTRYTYDACGRVVTVTDPVGAVSRHVYDQAGLATKIIDRLGRETKAVYDQAGRQVSQTNADGTRVDFAYDTHGKLKSVSADGRVLVRVKHDRVARMVTVRDQTSSCDTSLVDHVLRFDHFGRLLVKHTDYGEGQPNSRQEWTYDFLGRRTSYTGLDGQKITYTYDQVGRLTTIVYPELGQLVFDYDQYGRVCSCVYGDTRCEWDYDNGFITGQRLIRADQCVQMWYERDQWGRICKRRWCFNDDCETHTVTYAYDEANQLLSACGDNGQKHEWVYDQAGRLSRSTINGYNYDYAYNRASQLTSITSSSGVKTTYGYDRAGRRVSTHTTSGYQASYQWDQRSWLTGIDETGLDGHNTSTRLWVNALGELADINGILLSWDSAANIPTLTMIGSHRLAFTPAGIGITGNTPLPVLGDVLNPYDIHALTQIPSLPRNIGFSVAGTITINNMEWMGARLYDPTSHSFLSPDPFPAPAGAIWETNPYNYLANNPLNLTDPHGLKPITDTELKILTDYNRSRDARLWEHAANAWNSYTDLVAEGWNQTKDWFANNWEYIAAGAAVGLGVAVAATGIGGPLGAAMISGALISGGVSGWTQKSSTGSVDLWAVGKDALIGGVLGGVSLGAANLTKGAMLAKSASAQQALMRHASDKAVRKAGTGLWSMLNGTTKLETAVGLETTKEIVKRGSGLGFDLAVGNIGRNMAGDTVGNLATANIGYLADVATDPHKELTLAGFGAANANALISSTTAGTMQGFSLVGGPASAITPSSTGIDRTVEFSRTLIPDVSAQVAGDYAADQIISIHDSGNHDPHDFDENIATEGAATLSKGLYDAFPEIHINFNK